MVKELVCSNRAECKATSLIETTVPNHYTMLPPELWSLKLQFFSKKSPRPKPNIQRLIPITHPPETGAINRLDSATRWIWSQICMTNVPKSCSRKNGASLWCWSVCMCRRCKNKTHKKCWTMWSWHRHGNRGSRGSSCCPNKIIGEQLVHPAGCVVFFIGEVHRCTSPMKKTMQGLPHFFCNFQLKVTLQTVRF